jgi:hypothetical protein
LDGVLLNSVLHNILVGERLNYLSRGQEASLEHALVGVFERHNGQAENISDDEIWGAWMVMEAFYPPDALELSERYQALMEIQGAKRNG